MAQKATLNMAAVRRREFKKNKFLVTWLSSGSISAA